MHIPRNSLAISLLLAVAFAPLAHAVFDELAELKRELITWQVTHAADLSDLVDTLDDMSGPSFSDVAEGDWFSPYVSSVSAWGIVSGYHNDRGEPTGAFGPGNQVTVAEALKMALEAAQVEKEQCGLVPSLLPQAQGHWAAAYISCAEQKRMRILQEPFLDINQPAKRAQVLAIIHDAFGDTVPPFSSRFRDTRKHPLESDVAYATLRGVVSGDTNAQGEETGFFRPDAAINRAETAKIIYMRLRADAENMMAQKG